MRKCENCKWWMEICGEMECFLFPGRNDANNCFRFTLIEEK